MRARDNPFRTERIESLGYRFDEGNLDALLSRFSHMGFRGAIVGKKGTGKTTLVEEISDGLICQNLKCASLRLKEGGRQSQLASLRNWLTTTPPDHILLLDSAGQLSRWDWKWFESQSLIYEGLLITVHRQGRLPTLVTCQSSLFRFTELVSELVPDDSLSQGALAKLFTRHRGNIRNCFRSLYDEYDQL